MRLILVLILASASLAETAPKLLAGHVVHGLAVDDDRVIVRTNRGDHVIGRHGIATAKDGGDAKTLARAIEFAGFLWEATEDGVRRTRLAPHFTRYELPDSDRVHALAAGPDGSIWCGTQHGVVRYKDGRFTVAKSDLGLITTVAVDRDGVVWVGSGSAFTGAWRFDGTTWTHVEGMDAYVHKIAMDEAGTLWFAALNAPGGDRSEGHGAWYWSETGVRRADWLTGKRVYDVAARDPSGILWFATLRGLVAYRGSGRVKHYTPATGELAAEKVWCLNAASDGSLWLGYQDAGGGVSRLAGDRMSHFTAADGLCSDRVWSVAEGRRGVHWFATNNGLSRYDGRRWSCFHFTKAPLWPLLPRPDGSLWIGSLRDGLWHYQPRDRDAPKSSLRADGATVTWTSTDAWMNSAQQEIWTRYRIDRGAWSVAKPGGAGAVTLGPGRHRVEVQAIDPFGNAEDPASEIDVVVESPAGVATWIGIAIAAVVAGAIFVFRKRGSAARAT